jgi:hypothetical protein
VTLHSGLLLQHATALGVILTRLAAIGAAQRIYQEAGRDEIAETLRDEFVSLLDGMSDAERADLLVLAIGRCAPTIAMCQRCGHAHEASRPCPGPSCPTCGEPIPGLLSQCEDPRCVALAIEADAAFDRRADL